MATYFRNYFQGVLANDDFHLKPGDRQRIVGIVTDDLNMLASALRHLCRPQTPLLWGISQDNALMALVWGSDMGLDPKQTVRLNALLHQRNAGAVLRRAMLATHPSEVLEMIPQCGGDGCGGSHFVQVEELTSPCLAFEFSRQEIDAVLSTPSLHRHLEALSCLLSQLLRSDFTMRILAVVEIEDEDVPPGLMPGTIPASQGTGIMPAEAAWSGDLVAKVALADLEIPDRQGVIQMVEDASIDEINLLASGVLQSHHRGWEGFSTIVDPSLWALVSTKPIPPVKITITEAGVIEIGLTAARVSASINHSLQELAAEAAT